MILLRETIVYSLLLHSNENLTSRVPASANSTFPVGKAISANCSFLCTGCCASPPPAPPPLPPPNLSFWMRRVLGLGMQGGRYQFLKRHAYSCVRIICKTRPGAPANICASPPTFSARIVRTGFAILRSSSPRIRWLKRFTDIGLPVTSGSPGHKY